MLLLSLVLAAIISWLDLVTDFFPDFTPFYLVPIVVAAGLAGLRSGVIVAVAAASLEYASLALSARFESIGEQASDALIEALSHLVLFVAVAVVTERFLDRTRRILELERKRTQDIQIAKEAQKAVLFPKVPVPSDLEVGSKLIYARDIGGDYYFFFQVKDGFFFCIGEISGKSISAAMFTVILHESVVDALGQGSDLVAIVSKVNSRLFFALPDDMFVTCFFALIRNDNFTYVNAGHEPSGQVPKFL